MQRGNGKKKKRHLVKLAEFWDDIRMITSVYEGLYVLGMVFLFLYISSCSVFFTTP